jgi:hypothetical protein
VTCEAEKASGVPGAAPAALRRALQGACCALALLGGDFAHAAAPDTGFANFAFASELGSGIYEVDGRTLQVYQLQPSFVSLVAMTIPERITRPTTNSRTRTCCRLEPMSA